MFHVDSDGSSKNISYSYLSKALSRELKNDNRIKNSKKNTLRYLHRRFN